MTNPQRTVLITGAGSGLGRGMALYLARHGHSILATDLRVDAARETVALVEAERGRAEAHPLDVTSEESIRLLLAGLGARPIDVVVNNAGLQYVAGIDEYPTEKWDLLMDVLLKGPFLLTRAFLPGMRARGFGRFIHIGSFHALVASPFKSAYTAAKHALLGLSKVLALETAGVDITSNTICPGYMRTPLVDAQIADQARTRGIPEDEVVQRIMLAPMPKKTFITFDEVAAAAEYLISPLARNVTGQAITIDGGWTAQ
jgi:3-hydroxybutyrate dehydrogenase